MQNANENYKNLAVYNALVERTKYNWDNCNSLSEYLMQSYHDYHKHVLSLEGYVKLQVIEKQGISIELHAKIIEVVMYYLQGKPHTAYNLMSELLDLIKDILVQKSSRLDSSRGKFIFRARVQQEGGMPFTSREDMFHIPFEKRHLVSGQRFSIHGVPSVYLGESIYDCYLELGKPDLDRFWVSLFFVPLDNNSQKNTLIDLTFANQKHDISLLIHQVKNNIEEYISVLDKLVDDILLWPLIMACSIVCKFPNAPFKQEYIVPQILFHLCNDITGFSGVKYYSTKLDGINRKNLQRAMINYALPAQFMDTSGYCSYLANRLSLTKPITIKSASDIEIESRYGYTTCGLPIIRDMCENLKNDDVILALDRMTMYFNQLLHNNLDELTQLEK